MPPKLTDMSTWTGRTGHDGLRSFTKEDGTFWLEQKRDQDLQVGEAGKQGP